MAAQSTSWATKAGFGKMAILFWAILAALPLIGFVREDPSFDYYMFMGQSMLIYGTAVLGLNLLIGFNGQISLGHSAFFAVGAYTTAILMNFAGLPYWATIPIAAVVCFGAGFLFGLPALKLEGHYLALATFTLAIAVPQLLKYKAIAGWTGGVGGLLLEKPDPPFNLPLSPDQYLYYLCLFVSMLMFWLVYNLLRGRSGRAMMAIRDHPMAAGTMGIDTALYKTVTFGISAAITGVAGSSWRRRSARSSASAGSNSHVALPPDLNQTSGASGAFGVSRPRTLGRVATLMLSSPAPRTRRRPARRPIW